MPHKLANGLYEQHFDVLQSMANDCRDDPALRARVDDDPRSVFADRGLPSRKTPTSESSATPRRCSI